MSSSEESESDLRESDLMYDQNLRSAPLTVRVKSSNAALNSSKSSKKKSVTLVSKQGPDSQSVLSKHPQNFSPQTLRRPQEQRDTSPPLSDPFAEEQTYYVRPNRYNGPPSTWRDWTEDDRVIAESLDRLNATDLSIHLFNAHSLNTGAQGSQTAQSKKGKERATPINDRQAETMSNFAPPRMWAAWPLLPHEVERAKLITWPVTLEGLRAPEDLRPSAILEDCLQSTIQKLARKRWNNRLWIMIKEKTDDKAKFSTEIPDKNTEGSGSEDGSSKKKIVMDNDQNLNSRQPVPLADDKRAHHLLFPSSRHILSKLDDLLIGLHKARRACVGRSEDNLQYAQDETTDTEAASATSRGRARKRKRDTSVGTVDTRTSPQSPSDSVSKKTKTHRMPKLGLRDWSDVVGMSMLTGWDPVVVSRASERCARLFGENMLFRTFHESQGDAKSFFTESLAQYEDVDLSDEFENLGLSTGACQSCHSLGLQCAYQATQRCQFCERHALRCGPQNSSKPGLVCPYSKCKRHKKSFARAQSVRRHIEQVHKNDMTPYNKNLDHRQSGATERSVYCAINYCVRNKINPFSRPAKMYDHVRRKHPEFDLEALKEMEMTRRKESSSRTRSRSKSRRRSRAQSRDWGREKSDSDSDYEED